MLSRVPGRRSKFNGPQRTRRDNLRVESFPVQSTLMDVLTFAVAARPLAPIGDENAPCAPALDLWGASHARLCSPLDQSIPCDNRAPSVSKLPRIANELGSRSTRTRRNGYSDLRVQGLRPCVHRVDRGRSLGSAAALTSSQKRSTRETSAGRLCVQSMFFRFSFI